MIKCKTPLKALYSLYNDRLNVVKFSFSKVPKFNVHGVVTLWTQAKFMRNFAENK